MTPMRKALLLPVVFLMLTPAAGLAAQRPTRGAKAGDMAVSGNLGFANAFDNNFDGLEPVFTGTFEYYTTPRISWRGLLGFTSFDADSPPGASVDFTFVNGNFVYNWENKGVRPYVTGGLGIYSKDATPSLPPNADDTEVGLNVGGGVDLFVESRWAIKLEGTFHGLTGEEPDSFFLGTAGAKFWF